MDSVASYGKGEILDRWDGMASPMRVNYDGWVEELKSCKSYGRFGNGSALMFSNSYGAFVSKQLTTSSDKLHIVSANVFIKGWRTGEDQEVDEDNVKRGVVMSTRPGIGGSRTTWSLIMGDDKTISLRIGGHVSLPELGVEIISPVQAIVLEEWKQLAVEINILSGIAKIYVEGFEVGAGSFSPDDLPDQSSPVDEVIFSQPYTFVGRFDTMLVMDGSGSVNNSYLGPIGIIFNVLVGGTNDFEQVQDGITLDIKPNVPDQFKKCCVGDRSCRESESNTTPVRNSESGYLSTTIGDIFTQVPGITNTFAVQVTAVTRKGSADSTGFTFTSDNGSSIEEGISHFPALAYKAVSHVFNTDSEGNVWDTVGAGNSEFGIKHI